MVSYSHLEKKRGVCVVAKPGEPPEIMLKRFKKKFMKSGITQELRRRMHYEKPSDARRRKRLEAERRRKKELEFLEKQENF